MINLISLNCPCCNDALLCPWGIAQTGKIVETVAIMVQIPWKDCPTCGMSLDGIRFNTPNVGVKHQPGMKGLK